MSAALPVLICVLAAIFFCGTGQPVLWWPCAGAVVDQRQKMESSRPAPRMVDDRDGGVDTRPVKYRLRWR